MKTKLLMTSSAILMIVLGIIFSFIPEEILLFFKMENSAEMEFFIQLLGALYFGFGMLNWMAKRSLIGGIYNRPIAIANFAHFLIAGIGLVKVLIPNPEISFVFWILAVVYVLFAICFGVIMITHPIVDKQQ